MRIQDPVKEAMRAQKQLRSEGAQIVLCLVHMGLASDKPVAGRLLDFARAVTGFDVILGDHTGVQVKQREPNLFCV
jgi:2',3'-cyclic-nucleotide 2'-phosphodiesterase (5'-nucleotidase family)